MIVFKIHNNNNKKEYWRGLPFPSLVDFPDPRFKPLSLESPALAVGFFTTVPRGKPTGFKQLGTKDTRCTSLIAQLVKNPPTMQETQVPFLGQEDSPGERNGNPLQYTCPGMDREAW